jgi:hypothetical protein
VQCGKFSAYSLNGLYFPYGLRTKINYKDSLAQDIDLVKLLILYIVFYEYSIHRKYVKILLYFTAVEKHTASPQIMYISKLSSIESTAL